MYFDIDNYQYHFHQKDHYRQHLCVHVSTIFDQWIWHYYKLIKAVWNWYIYDTEVIKDSDINN